MLKLAAAVLVLVSAPLVAVLIVAGVEAVSAVIVVELALIGALVLALVLAARHNGADGSRPGPHREAAAP